MRNLKTLTCYHCNSVIIILPEDEVLKLNNLTFECECCNYENLLKGTCFVEGSKDNLISLYSLSQAI